MKIQAWFVNADNWRGDATADELESIAGHQPHVIAFVEATGNRLPPIEGYRRIADSSTASRRNIVCYVRDDLKVSHIVWTDMRHGWDRTENPGRHEPRSILRCRIGGRTRLFVAHGPDPRAKGPAIREHTLRLAALVNLNPLWPTIVLWDSNHQAKQLARLTRTWISGHRVDTANLRRVQDATARYLESWPRADMRKTIRFGGDHKYVWRGSITVADRYCKTTPAKKEKL